VGEVSKTFEVIFKEFADSDTFVMSRGLLEDYKRKAAQDERKRIMRLLKEMQETALATGSDKGKQTGWVLENAIVLVKGENK
jgi:hypothetical protein